MSKKSYDAPLRKDELDNLARATGWCVNHYDYRFSSSRFFEQFPTLDEARACIKELPVTKGGNRPVIYAITDDNRQVFVPDDYPAAYPGAVPGTCKETVLG